MTSAASLGAHTDLATANSSIEALPDVKKLMQDQQAMAAAANTVIATASQIVSDKSKVANQQVTDANASIKTANQNIADAQAVLNDNNSTQDQKDAAQAAIVQANLQLGSATIALGAATTAVLNWGPKGDYSRGLNLVTAILVGGVAGEGVGQVAANISAPYVANAIGDYFAQPGHQNETAQLLSHAVLGAVLAVANGGSAAAGAGAGASGELAAQVISRQLYPDAYDANGNFHPEKLDANQLNTVIALSTAVGAFVGGVTGGSVLNASVGGSVAQNAATYNRLASHDEKILAKQLAANSNGKYTEQQIEDAMRASSNNSSGESVSTGTTVNVDGNKAMVSDDGAKWAVVQQNGTLQLVQQIPLNIPADLMTYIQQNTGNTYSWSPVQNYALSMGNPSAVVNPYAQANCSGVQCTVVAAPPSLPTREQMANFTDKASTGTGLAAIWAPPPVDAALLTASIAFKATNYSLSPPSKGEFSYDVATTIIPTYLPNGQILQTEISMLGTFLQPIITHVLDNAFKKLPTYWGNQP